MMEAKATAPCVAMVWKMNSCPTAELSDISRQCSAKSPCLSGEEQ